MLCGGSPKNCTDLETKSWKARHFEAKLQGFIHFGNTIPTVWFYQIQLIEINGAFAITHMYMLQLCFMFLYIYNLFMPYKDDALFIQHSFLSIHVHSAKKVPRHL